MKSSDLPIERENHLVGGLVLGLSLVFAAISCSDQAGGWNDGSRLATVESLVDRGTFVIDDSIFVQPTEQVNPYAADSGVGESGTLDKLFIEGHYYSDKPPMQPLMMAAAYWALQRTTGLTANQSPRAFCYWMTLVSSGLAYAIAVWCVYLIGRPLRISIPTRLLLAGSFALTTVAVAYMQYVNNHIFLLGVAMPLLLGLAWLAVKQHRGESSRLLLIWLGLLTGLAYSVDLGAGMVLLMCMGIYIVLRVRRPGGVLLFAIGCLPSVAIHHWINFEIGGVIKPINAVPEYFLWPGCPFNEENMTGRWKHDSIFKLVEYLASIALGKKGFFGYNLVTFLVIPGAIVLLRQRRLIERPEILLCIAWSIGTWLLFGVASNNYSGLCRSIRWFVPLLAPAFFILAVLLREKPHWKPGYRLLAAGGLSLGIWMWITGPWSNKIIFYFWPVQALCLLGCWWLTRHGKNRGENEECLLQDDSP